MKAIKQQHFSGCAVACVAAILNSSYNQALESFNDGQERARFRGFFCREIIDALQVNYLTYCLKYVKRRKNYNYPSGTIVYLQKTTKHPIGHYLCKSNEGWMDSWINFPRLNAKAGFRKRLPGKPTYAILPLLKKTI